MRIGLAALALACACGSASSTADTPARPETVRAPQLGGNLTMVAVTDASRTLFAQPIEAVWAVMPAAYDSLSIPRTLMDPTGHVISSQGFRIRQRLGRTPLSRFIDCGATQIGANADSYEVYLTVTTKVSSGPDGTILSSTVEALARPLSFNQEYSRCSSRGVLETRIADVAKARLAR